MHPNAKVFGRSMSYVVSINPKHPHELGKNHKTTSFSNTSESHIIMRWEAINQEQHIMKSHCDGIPGFTFKKT